MLLVRVGDCVLPPARQSGSYVQLKITKIDKSKGIFRLKMNG
jgi:hypothetical protein